MSEMTVDQPAGLQQELLKLSVDARRWVLGCSDRIANLERERDELLGTIQLERELSHRRLRERDALQEILDHIREINRPR